MSKKEILNWVSLITFKGLRPTRNTEKKFIKISHHTDVIPICIDVHSPRCRNYSSKIYGQCGTIYETDYGSLTFQYEMIKPIKDLQHTSFCGYSYKRITPLCGTEGIYSFLGKKIFSMCIYNNAVPANKLSVENLVKTVFSSIFIISCPQTKEVFVWGNDKKLINSLSEIRHKFKFNCTEPIMPDLKSYVG